MQLSPQASQGRCKGNVVHALMIALMMKMRHILRQRMAERRFSKEDQPRETFLLDRAHPAFRVGVQVGRSGWQDDTLDTSLIDDLLKRSTEFGVAVMDEVLAGRQEAPLLHREVARHLHHPGLIGMRRDASHIHLPAPKVDEEEDVVGHEPTQRPDVGREEVGRHKDVHRAYG